MNGNWHVHTVLYLHHRWSRELKLSCEQAEPPELRLTIGANPQTLFSNKADLHYPELMPEMSKVGKGQRMREEGRGEVKMARQCICSIKQSGSFGGFLALQGFQCHIIRIQIRCDT